MALCRLLTAAALGQGTESQWVAQQRAQHRPLVMQLQVSGLKLCFILGSWARCGWHQLV